MNKTKILSALMAFAIIATPSISGKTNNNSKIQNYQITAYAAKKTGWVESKGYLYYYDKNGKMIKDELKKIDGYNYYFDKKGRMLEGQWNSSRYYFNESGVMVTGCAPTGVFQNDWCNFDSKGWMIEPDGYPWVLNKKQTVYKTAGTKSKTNNTIKKGEIVFITEQIKNKAGETWGKINYEGKFKGYILMIDSKGNKLGSGRLNDCYEVIDKKFYYIPKTFEMHNDNLPDEFLEADYQF